MMIESKRSVASAARRSLFLSSCVAASFLATTAPALAGDNTPPPMFENWLANAAYLMGLIYMAVRVWQLNRPNPPNHRQFAPIDHQHSGVLTHHDKEACQANQAREIMTIRQEMGGLTGKLERQMDHIRNTMTTQHDQLVAALDKFNEHGEERVRRMHQRLDPLPAAIAANTRSIETHLADHRAGKA